MPPLTCAACGHQNPEGARFCNGCGHPLVTAPLEREQRKTVTVVFCDVTGSTALGERVDPEPLRALLARYFERMRGIVDRHGGSVEKFIGDAVMAVFGVPVVHEDDALRAVRAAAEMREALPELGVAARIGVATGEVVVGTAERLATGDVVNVAARLQQLAPTGEILMSAPTYRLVRGAVSAEAVGPFTLRGKSSPVEGYRLRMLTGEPARRSGGRMIGRERPLQMLQSAFEQARHDPACYLFTVLGPAGVGKSRLVAEFLRGVEARVARGRCLSYGEGITYWPVIEVLRELGEPAGDDPAAAVVRDLLGGGGGTFSAPEIAAAIRRTLAGAARDGPLVVVWDDLQWGAPAFLDLVEHVADWSRGAPLLLICMARPDLLDHRPGWAGGKLNATTVLLESLTAEETDELIDSLGAPDAALRHRIRDAAEGNPLFVEEMLALLEDADAEDVTVPPTIQALLAARLDQLDSSERSVLERGAVEGHIFHRGAVEALANGEPRVEERLLGLVRKELIRPEPAQLPGDEAFRFRHLLIRDAAYDALPKTVRAHLHLRFAGWLEKHGHALAEFDEIVGYHLEQAHRYAAEVGGIGTPLEPLSERAGNRLADAGRRASEREDFPAAINLLTRASAHLSTTSPRRADVLIELGYALAGNGRRDDAAAAFTAAGALGDEVAGARARVGRAVLDNNVTIAGSEALGAVHAEIPVLERLGSDAGLAEAWEFAATLQTWAGQAGRARPAYERALQHARASRHRSLERRIIGHRIVQEAWGDVPADQGYRECDALLPGATGTPLEPYVLAARALHSTRQERFAEARRDIRRAHELLREFGHLLMAAACAQIEAHLELAAGNATAAEHIAREGYDALGAMNDQGFRSTVGCYLAWALLRLGRLDEAERVAIEAAQLAAEDDYAVQADSRQVRALVHARRGEFEEAERLARRAIALTEPTDSWSERGTTNVTLAEVLDGAGRRDEARDALEDAVALFRRKADRAASADARGRFPHLVGGD